MDILKECQEVFDGLKDTTVKELTDGKYVGKLTNAYSKVSMNGNTYIQMEFFVDGYETVVKRVMIEGRNVKNQSIFFNLARKFGYITLDLDDAVSYLKDIGFYADLTVSDTKKDFYNVLVANTRYEL